MYQVVKTERLTSNSYIIDIMTDTPLLLLKTFICVLKYFVNFFQMNC